MPGARHDPQALGRSDRDASVAAPLAWDNVRCAGPRELHAALLDALRRHKQAVRAEPRLLGRSLLVVVPSRHLATQVQALLAREGSVGVQVATAAQAARLVLGLAGESELAGGEWFDAVLRRRLRGRASLERRIVHGEGSWAQVAATVGDLLDAGLDEDCAEAARECLAAGGSEDERELLELAIDVERGLRSARVGRVHARHALAARLLGDASGPTTRLLRERILGVVLCGFADATGHLASFLEALRARLACAVLWDSTQSGLAGANERHGRALREALGVGLRAVEGEARPRLARAGSRDKEARHLAAEIRALLDAGTQPESIAIVVRQHDHHSARIEQHLRDLGVPVASSAPRRDGATRPLLALAECWDLGAEATLRAACAAFGATGPQVRLGLAVLGLRTLGELACESLLERVPPEGVRLPTRLFGAARGEESDSRGGSDESESESEAEEPVQEERGDEPDDGRRLPREVVVRLSLAARALLDAWRPRATPPETLAAWSMFLATRVEATLDALDGGATDSRLSARLRVESLLQALARHLPDEPLEAEDLRRAICDALRRAAEPPALEGGGVVLASASQLRSCAFRRLHLPSCEHGRWPRSPQEDPLLSDAARGLLQAVLPALSRKLDGREEEDGLRRSLVLAADEVVVSHAKLDESGKEVRASAWFEDWAAGGAVEDWRGDEAADRAVPRTPRDWALRTALELRLSRPRDLQAVDAIQLRAARVRHGLPVEDAEETHLAAQARSAWLAECEAPPRGLRGSSPLLGADCSISLGAVHATLVERFVVCPWQTLLQRGLRLRPPLDPEAELPTIDARLVGIALHEAARLCAPRSGGKLDALRESEGHAPARTGLAEIVRTATRTTLEAHSLAGRGLEPLLERRVGDLLRIALEYSAPALHAGDGWVAAEVDGAWDSGLPRLGVLRFRADRVERVAGVPQLVDLKTGKPVHGSTSPKLDNVQKAVFKHIRSARIVQGALYSLASGQPARYDHVRDEAPAPNDNSRYYVDLSRAETRADFLAALATVDAALHGGHWPPRLLDHTLLKRNAECARCEVSLACRQDDSAATRRLRATIEHARAAGDAPALLALWDLPRAGMAKP